MPGVVLLIEAPDSQHDHAVLLRAARLIVEVSSRALIEDRDILRIAPALIAVELEPSRTAETLEFARRLRALPQLQQTPIIVFATLLHAEHIEAAARSGVLWLQIGPIDSMKLVAAVRGLLSATEGSQA